MTEYHRLKSLRDSFEQVKEMEELNEPSDWEDVDVSLVVGANDTVWDAQRETKNEPVIIVEIWMFPKIGVPSNHPI